MVVKTESERDLLLNEAYEKFLQVGLGDYPLDGLDDFVDENISGYGTTVEEKIENLSQFRDLSSERLAVDALRQVFGAGGDVTLQFLPKRAKACVKTGVKAFFQSIDLLRDKRRLFQASFTLASCLGKRF